MSNNKCQRVVIGGGGPAGSVAALCLRKLGRDVVVFEREKFPRYRVGESLLPGTMAILTRLGVMDKIKAANFVEKRAATFIWGPEQTPWTFTFSTPKTAPWVKGQNRATHRLHGRQTTRDLHRCRKRAGLLLAAGERSGHRAGDLSRRGSQRLRHWPPTSRSAGTP